MDGACRTLGNTLLAKLALGVVDVGNIVLHCDSLERTYLRTLAAADAGSLAGLARSRTLVLVYAGYVHTHIPAALVAKLDDSLRTSLHAGSAGSTLLLVDNRKTCCRVHSDGAELADRNAVATSETSERTSCVAAVESGLDTARLIAAVLVCARTVLTRSVATYHSHLRFLSDNLNAENGCNLLHTFVASYRTEAAVQIWRRLNAMLGKSAATCLSAASAVCTRQYLLHLVDPRILLDVELLRNDEKDNCEGRTKNGEDCNSPDNSLCHYSYNLFSCYSLCRT